MGKINTYGVEISEAQQTAGIAAMVGNFTCGDVEKALRLAGVEDAHRQPVAYRTADKLLQRERKAKRIAPVQGKRGAWRVL